MSEPQRYGAAIVSGIVAALLGLVGVIYRAQAIADTAITDQHEQETL